MYLRIDIVNKNQYETSENYKEIKILVPNDSIELEKDFKYLGLDYYNLDTIISVGYRVNSKQGIIFRKWTTKVLKDYKIN